MLKNMPTLTLDATLLGADPALITLKIQDGVLQGWQLVTFSEGAAKSGSGAPDRVITRCSLPVTMEIRAEFWPLPPGEARDNALYLAQAQHGCSVLELIDKEAVETPAYLFPADLDSLVQAAHQAERTSIELKYPAWYWGNFLGYTTLMKAPPWNLAILDELDNDPGQVFGGSMRPQMKQVLTRVRANICSLPMPVPYQPPTPVQREWVLMLKRQPRSGRPGEAVLQVDRHPLLKVSFHLAGTPGNPGAVEYVNKAARSYVKNSWGNLSRRYPAVQQVVVESILIELGQQLDLAQRINQEIWVRNAKGEYRKYAVQDGEISISRKEPDWKQRVRQLLGAQELQPNEQVFHPQYGWLPAREYVNEHPSRPVIGRSSLWLHDPQRSEHQPKIHVELD